MSDSHHHDSHHAHHDDGLVHVHVHPVSLYLKVFAALIFFTFLTVAVAEVHLGEWNFFVAVVIATMKAALVALFFMHLKEERSTIWRILYFTFFFVLGLFLLTLLAWVDPIYGTTHWHH